MSRNNGQQLIDPASRWSRVSADFPCPICHGVDNCEVAEDRRAVFCGRIEEDSVQENEGGQFLHYLKKPSPHRQKPPKQQEIPASVNVNGSSQTWNDLAEEYAANTNRKKKSLAKFAKSLGVSVDSLNAIGIGWDGSCWTFPERDAAGNVIGILRRFPDGKKSIIKGGKRGLIFPSGVDVESCPLLLVEGPTDTAAALTLGIAAIGRPNNLGGVDHLCEILADAPAELEIIVLGENDEKADGKWPGKEGAKRTAEKLSKKLSRRIYWALTPDNKKDIRDWIQQDTGDRDFFLSRLSLQTVTPSEFLKWQQFPVDALPKILRRFVRKASVCIGCDESFVALPLFAALASAVGNSRSIRLRRGWDEPSVLWAVIIGTSGTLKSPAIDVALRFVRKKQEQLFEEHASDLDVWQAEKQVDGKDKSKRPVLNRVIVSDTTVEALADRLDENKNGVLLACDELSSWLRSFGQYKAGKGNDAPSYLTMHGARELIVDRKTGEKKTIFVKRAAVSIAGGIQPEVLREILSKEHFINGMAARMIFTMPPRVQKKWTDAELTEEDRGEMSAVFKKLYTLQDEVTDKTTVNGTSLTLSGDAKALFIEFYEQHAVEESFLSGDLAAAWSKLEGAATRIALIFHLTRWASGDDVDALEVDAVSMKSALLITAWLKRETRRVYAALKEKPEENEQRQLIELIERKGGTVTVREITRSSRQFGTDADKVEKKLNSLYVAGHGKWRVVDTRGRQRREFVLTAVDTVDVAKSQ